MHHSENEGLSATRARVVRLAMAVHLASGALTS